MFWKARRRRLLRRHRVAPGDVLAGVHVPPPPGDPDDHDAVLSEIWAQVPQALRRAEEDELADDVRHLRPAAPLRSRRRWWRGHGHPTSQT